MKKELSTKVSEKYKAYRFSYTNRTVYLVLQFVLFAIVLLFTKYLEHLEIEDVRIVFLNNDEKLQIVFFAIWFAVITIKLILHFADYIPLLDRWINRVERREMDRIKNTYEYQVNRYDRN
ncbi:MULTISPECIES: hypothetical protein [Myroides]|uniref:2TM domain-containing protein n=1 Tax=Myroides albus TaxID=2562892 RepID=A0A6I3LQS8_9FLAO|nr:MULTISPECIES: hypothetical protein [Myroides]MTG98315.1 hypothetical protein [Myroides albus]MVX36584.1 hypothetical protein [Myroides sp. LoEW2-1]UVD79612.1 hypothetical protein NWE55_16055 [Myroides albus]